jgi:CRISPR-associated protein Csx10
MAGIPDPTLELEIQVESPLLLGGDHAYASVAETKDYIPGSVLRGSLARLLQEAGAEADLLALFGSEIEAPIFENLYVTPGVAYPHPLPLSARTCKVAGGFAADNEENHGVGDILIQQAVFELYLEARARLSYLYEPRCPRCQEEVTQPKAHYYQASYYPSEGKHQANYQTTSVPVRRQARTAIDRQRYTAADQLLYTLETIEPGDAQGARVRFRGAVHVRRPEHHRLLTTWLPQVAWLGRGRSRGLGQVSLKVVEDTASRPDLMERLTRFNEALWRRLFSYQYLTGVELIKPDTLFFSLDLLAPTIVSRCAVPTTEPDLADLNLDPAQYYRAFSDFRIQN